MSTILREELKHGEDIVDIFIETEERAEAYDYGFLRGDEGAPKVVTRAFEKGMALIRSCAEQVATTVREVSDIARPEEVEVKFGVKLVGEVGAMIAKTGTEGQMEVTLKWKLKNVKA